MMIQSPIDRSESSDTDAGFKLSVTYTDGATREVMVGAGQTVLDAAEDAGVPIVNSCQAGVCGTCVARCISGRYTLQNSIGLSLAEKASGRILACQTVLQSDCELELDYPLGNNSARVVGGLGRVISLEQLGPSVVLLKIDVSGLDEAISYEPGQFAQLRIPGSANWRSYSFVNAVADGFFEFLIRILPQGRMSDYLTHSCKPGDLIEIRGPKGAFSLRQSARPIVLLAGGTGISAILALAEATLARDPGGLVRLLYGVTDPADLVLCDRLDALTRANPCFTWRGIASLPGKNPSAGCGLITDLLDPADFRQGDVDIYLCGPPPMVDAVRQWLFDNRLGSANVYFEKFLPSGGTATGRIEKLAALKADAEDLREAGRGTAIVVGGSIAGIAAAKVLSAHYPKVIILEKDPEHRKMEGRPGAAQGWHLHHLLIAGQIEIERIFPGIVEEMVAAGAFKVDMGQQYRVFLAGAWKKKMVSGIEIVCAARPLLEWCLRRRLDDEPGIEYRYESELCELVVDPRSDAVTGVIADCGGELESIACEFLVDAAGKNTPLPRLLGEHGYDQPALEMDDINCFYSTMLHRVPKDRAWQDKVMVITYPYRPHQRHYAAQYFTDSSRAVLSTTLVGYDCYDPPRNAEEFREFARRMPTQAIGDELDGLEPVSPVYNFRYPTMQRFLYREVKRRLGGIIALGDSLASADPVSGAGMTKAFLEVGALRDLLGQRDMRSAATANEFYQAVGGLGDLVWSAIREQTLRYPWIRDVENKRGRLAGLQNWYVDRLTEAIHEYPDLYRTFLAVTHFVSPPSALMKPAVVARVLGKWLATRLRGHNTLIQKNFGRYEDCRPEAGATRL